MLKEYWGEIITFITTGGLMTLLNHFRDGKKDKIEEFEKIIAHWQKMLDKVEENQKQSEENERLCEERYQRLSDEFDELKRAFNDLQRRLPKTRKSTQDETK
jgi:predicted nuclease with TOPRIM domain